MSGKSRSASASGGPPAGSELVAVSARRAAPAGIHAQTVVIPPPATGHDRDEAGRPAAPGTDRYLHAFRRRWPSAIAWGLLCGTAAAVPAWILATDRYTATALLELSANERQLVFQTADRPMSSSFDMYKATQQQLLVSDVVLVAALRNPEAANLAGVREQEDPVRWLGRTLRVDFPGNAEIMRVSLTGPRPKETAVLVRAVVDAYMNEVVNADRRRQANRLDELNRLFGEKESEMRTRRTALKQLAEQLGTGDTGALALKQQLALQQYGESRAELSRIRGELQRARDDLQIKQTWLEALDAAGQEAPDPELAVENDPALARLVQQGDEIDNRLAEIHDTTREPLRSQLSAEHLATKKVIAEKTAKLRKELTEKAKKRGRVNLDIQMAELKSRGEILAAQEKAAVKDLDEQRQKASQVGSSSIDLEMMRSELQYLDRVLGPIADERERLKVELRSTPRISVVQRAETPRIPESKPRLKTVAAAGGGGFAAAVFLVLWWDVRKRRINSAADLSRGLGLTVVGALPQLPRKMLPQPGRNKPVATAVHGARHPQWLDSAVHAVDSLAARLFLRKSGESLRVLLVSSAVQGEGKTTLSVQLAVRLARTGARTLLVDFDLRRPAIHRIFGMPRGPGVGECLRKQFDLGQVVHPTAAENLFVVTAGNLLSDAPGPLANGVTAAFFEQARAAFDFVVVDSSPILPVIDGLLVSQHADTVVLSVRRDASQAPHIMRACEKLSAFGARRPVTVLNESREELDGGNYYYHENTEGATV